MAFLSSGQFSVRLAYCREALRRESFGIVTVVHSVYFPDLFWWLTGLLTTHRECDRVVVTSRAAETAVCSACAAVRELLEVKTPLNLVRIPFGIDSTSAMAASKASARMHLGIPADRTVLLYVGRINEHFKADLDPLIRVFARIHERSAAAHLIIAGSGESASIKRLHGTMASLNLLDSVRICPDPANVVRDMLLRAADVFVSPVDNVQESFGLALLEAMAASLPVVASDWSGYRDIVDHETTGFLVPTFVERSALEWASPRMSFDVGYAIAGSVARSTIVSPVHLERYLSALVEDRNLRQRMGSAGRRRVGDLFSAERMRANYAEIFDAIDRALTDPRRRRSSGKPSLVDVFGTYASGYTDAIVETLKSGAPS